MNIVPCLPCLVDVPLATLATALLSSLEQVSRPACTLHCLRGGKTCLSVSVSEFRAKGAHGRAGQEVTRHALASGSVPHRTGNRIVSADFVAGEPDAREWWGRPETQWRAGEQRAGESHARRPPRMLGRQVEQHGALLVMQRDYTPDAWWEAASIREARDRRDRAAGRGVHKPVSFDFEDARKTCPHSLDRTTGREKRLKHGKALFAAESPATTRHAAFTRALLDQLAVRFPQPEVPDEVERVSSPSCTS